MPLSETGFASTDTPLVARRLDAEQASLRAIAAPL